MPYVVMLSGAAKGKAIKLDGEVTLGRHRSCDLVIRLAQISRRHAKIFPKNGKWVVTDLGTQNGTQVNGETVVEHVLKDGDEISISSVQMRFRDEGAAAAAAAPAAAPAPAAGGVEETSNNKPVEESAGGAEPPNVPAGGGIRFGLGGLATSGSEDVEEDPAEGTAFMDMGAILDHDKEATEFIDMNELMLGEDTGPALPAGPLAVMGLLIVGLLAVLGYLFFFGAEEEVIPPKPLPSVVLERGSKLIYTYPKHDRYELSNKHVVALVPQGSGLVELVGLQQGDVKITLHTTENKKPVQYVGSIEVKVPMDELICQKVREDHKDLSPTATKRLAKQWLSQARSKFHTREQHLSNLYYSYLQAQQAYCLLEQVNPKPATFYEAKKLRSEADKELKERFAESRRRIQQFINVREWRRLRDELEKLLQLLPDPRDWRNQRARKLKDFYYELMPRD